MDHSHYFHLAKVFDFPGPGYALEVQHLLGLLRDKYAKAALQVQYFLEGIPKKTVDLQELYTRSFDVQSITTLDVGYVLFGDDYKRAELLSHLTREHSQVENNCRGELADHLPNLLRLMPKLKDKELLSELVMEILVPALMLMIRELDEARIEKKKTTYQKHYKTLLDPAPGSAPALYCKALQATLEVLAQDFHIADRMAQLSEWSLQPPSADFLGWVEKEMNIEQTANPNNSGCDS